MALTRVRIVNGTFWNVLMMVLARQYRYGGREARLTEREIARNIDRSLSTVKRAMHRLKTDGIVVALRRGVYRVEFEPRRADTARVVVEAFPMDTSEEVAVKETPVSSAASVPQRETAFSERQKRVVEAVLAELSSCVGEDVWAWTMPDPAADDVPGRTIAARYAAVAQSKNRKNARDFVKTILAMKKDPRLYGTEIIEP